MSERGAHRPTTAGAAAPLADTAAGGTAGGGFASQLDKIKLDASGGFAAAAGRPLAGILPGDQCANTAAEDFLLLTWQPPGPLLGTSRCCPAAHGRRTCANWRVSSVVTVWTCRCWRARRSPCPTSPPGAAAQSRQTRHRQEPGAAGADHQPHLRRPAGQPRR